MEIGPYTIERELGRGGMGAVYLGRLAGDPRPYAVKVIHADLAGDPDLLARFEREGKVLERLDHPNLVALRARGHFSGGLWLAMDYVEGESLEERISRGGPLPSPIAGQLLIGVAAGLAHAHRSGILHRDLKPANVLLRSLDGQALVADFGLALPLDLSQHLTQTGEVLGSPGYLAPEQCGLGGGSTPATDVYGLGALLYAILTGQPPLRGRSLIETLDFVLTRRPQPPREFVPDVDPGLEAICLRCLAKEPSERYGDAQEVLEALTSEPTAPASRRRSWVLTLTGAGILGAIAVLFALSLSQGWRAGSPTPVLTPEVSATPLGVAPTPRGTSVAEAIRSGRWRAGHERAEQLEGNEASWARYQLLAGELEATGEEGQDWRDAREAALKAASQETTTWSRVLCALIESLEDPFLGERLSAAELGRLRVSLAQAEGIARVLTPAQEVAILRARAEIAYRFADFGESEQDWSEAVARHRAWLVREPGAWRAEFLGGLIHAAASELSLAFEALLRSDVAARRQGQPWARFALLETRSRWLRTAGRVRSDQAWLSRTVTSAEQAPRSIRVRASLPLAVHLVQEGRSGEAVALLESLAPSPRASARIRLGWLEALARASTEGGGDHARVLSLLSPEALAEASPRQAERLRIARVILLCGLERFEEARALLERLPQNTSQSGALLDLRAAILVGDQARFSAGLRGKAGTIKSRMIRWAELGILDALEPQARLDLSAARQQLVQGFAREPGQLIQELLNGGRWEEALDALELLANDAQVHVQGEFAARWACQIIVRAREDEEPGSERFRTAQARCRSFVRRLEGKTSGATGLLALIEAQGDPPEQSRVQLHRDFVAAKDAQPAWEELHRADLALLEKWKRMALAPSDLAGLENSAAQRWTSHSKGIAARLASLLQPGPPDLLRLSNLAHEAKAKGDRNQQVAIRESIRARYLAGEIKAQPLISILCASAAWAGRLRADRRWHLLEAADLLEPPEEHAHEVLAYLALIEAWCGLPIRAEDLARYRRLESAANVGLGQSKAALEAARPLEFLGTGLTSEVRAGFQCQLGRAEVLAGEAGGLARIRAALELHASPRGYVLLARCSSGEEQALAYQRALGFPIPPAWITSLISEIKAAGHSVVALQRAALPALEARSQDPDCGLRLASALFEADRNRDHALLLWETYGIGSQNTLSRASALPPKVQDSLTRAAAGEFFSLQEQVLVQALQGQFVARAALAADPKRPGHFATIEAATARLASAAARAGDLGDRLRVPLHVHAAFGDLGQLQPERLWQYSDQGAQVLQTYKERGGASLQTPILVAYHHRMRGQFQLAVDVLQEARAGPGKAIPGLLGRATLDLAVNLSDLGDEDKALLACHEAKKSLTDHGDRARAWLLEAQIYLRQNRLDEAASAVQIASDVCPRTKGEQTLGLRAQVCWGRVLLRLGKLREGGMMFSRLSALIQEPTLDPLLVGMITNFSAELDLSLGRFDAALQKAEKCLVIQPASAEAHLVRVEAFVGLGDSDAAKVAAREAIGDVRLSPRDRARVQARLDALP